MSKFIITPLIFSAALISSVASFASEPQPDTHGKPEKIYLKSGETVSGYLQSQIPGESVTYITTDGQTLVIPVSDIKRIDRDRHKEYRQQGLKQGYKGLYGFSFTVATDKNWMDFNPNNRIELSTTQGYQFNHCIYAGAGVAWQYFYEGYALTDSAFSLIPVFAHVRWTPIDHRFSPIAELKAGGFFGKMSGWYLQPSIGIRAAINDKYGFDLTIGYTIQRITGDVFVPYDPEYQIHKPKLDGVNVSIAIDI